MGMFDYVICEAELPDGFTSSEFQTKDFDCILTNVKIAADGRLYILDYRLEEVPKHERPYPDDDGLLGFMGALRRTDERWRDLDFHGWFTFYGCSKDGTWSDFRAKYTDGNFVTIERVPR